MTAPIRSIPEPHEIIAVVRRHQDLREVFRVMKERLGLTNDFCDDVGGLTKGHTDKILGPSESKSWGPTTFDLFCEMFAIEFHVRVDMAAVKRMEAIWENRERLAHLSHTNRVSRKLLDKAKPLIIREHLKKANAARNSKLSCELRSKIARKAGKSRMRKVTKAQRSAMNKKGWQTRRARLNAASKPAATASRSEPTERDRRSSQLICTKPELAAC